MYELNDKAADLLKRYKNRGELSSAEVSIIQLLRRRGKDLLPYLNGSVETLVRHICKPIDERVLKEYRRRPISAHSKKKIVIDISSYAEANGYSTHQVTRWLRDQGYDIKRDNGHVYDYDRVITYMEI